MSYSEAGGMSGEKGMPLFLGYKNGAKVVKDISRRGEFNKGDSGAIRTLVGWVEVALGADFRPQGSVQELSPLQRQALAEIRKLAGKKKVDLEQVLRDRERERGITAG